MKMNTMKIPIIKTLQASLFALVMTISFLAITPTAVNAACNPDDLAGCNSSSVCTSAGGKWFPEQVNERGRIERNAICDFSKQRCENDGGSWKQNTSTCDYSSQKTTCEAREGRTWNARTRSCDGAVGNGLDVGSLPNITPGDDTVTKAFNTVVAILATVAVLIIVLAGFKYVTSAGDAQGVASARQAIIYAVVGLAVTTVAWSIVRFVLQGI